MTTYNFPLGTDHDDRDLARVSHDLVALPTRVTRACSARRHALRRRFHAPVRT